MFKSEGHMKMYVLKVLRNKVKGVKPKTKYYNARIVLPLISMWDKPELCKTFIKELSGLMYNDETKVKDFNARLKVLANKYKEML